MRKFIAAALCAGLLFSQGIYAAPAFAAAENPPPSVLRNASAKTGILIIAPVEFKTQDFLKIATETFGKGYTISQNTQDAWATYCWDNGFAETDPLTKKETLADFVKTTYFDKVIFIIFKDVSSVSEDHGASYSGSWLFGSVTRIVQRRSAIETRVVIMNHEGETLKVFEESYTDASMTSELRANRGAFKGLCQKISERLSTSRAKQKYS